MSENRIHTLWQPGRRESRLTCGIFRRSDEDDSLLDFSTQRLHPKKQQLNPCQFRTYLNPQTLTAVVGDFTNFVRCRAIVGAAVTVT